jgi:hypothetical protein
MITPIAYSRFFPDFFAQWQKTSRSPVKQSDDQEIYFASQTLRRTPFQQKA